MVPLRMHGAGGFGGLGGGGHRKAPNAGAPQAASFTDDTSLPFVGCRVSIHAQIIRENQINWYFLLKDRTPHNNGEFKVQVVNTFFGLDRN